MIEANIDEGYVWRKCGPDDDEVLHSTLFQAVIEKKNNLKCKNYNTKIKSSKTCICGGPHLQVPSYLGNQEIMSPFRDLFFYVA